MRRTEPLQGLRLMKFEDVYGRCYRGDLSQAEASVVDGCFTQFQWLNLMEKRRKQPVIS